MIFLTQLRYSFVMCQTSFLIACLYCFDMFQLKF